MIQEVGITKWIEEAERLKFDENKSWTEVTKTLWRYFPTLSFEQVREKIRGELRRSIRYKKQNQPITEQNKASYEYKQDGTTISTKVISLTDGEELSPEKIIEAHGLDPALWTVISYVNNFWNAQQKGGKKLIMYQSKLTVRPNAKGISFDRIDKLFKSLERKSQPIKLKNSPIIDGVDVEINIADLHIGKLCWDKETGTCFNIKIAEKIFSDILSDIVCEIRQLPVSQIYFVWSNDFFNTDTTENTATAGTRQDNDGRWAQIFDAGTELLTRAILTLRDIAPITTFYTPSNHDVMTGYHAVKFIEAYFKNDANVFVDTSPSARKYYILGNTLVGYCHGDKEGGNGTKERASRLASCMPIEAPELWAKAATREFHTGHLHSEQMIQEINGVIVRRISSPTASDAWHTTSGFIGAVRKAQTFVYHPTRGQIRIINSPI